MELGDGPPAGERDDRSVASIRWRRWSSVTWATLRSLSCRLATDSTR